MEQRLPTSVRQQAVELYFQKLRAEEELTMVKEEMTAYCTHLFSKRQALLMLISKTPLNAYDLSVRSLQIGEIQAIECMYDKTRSLFSKFIPDIPEMVYLYDSPTEVLSSIHSGEDDEFLSLIESDVESDDQDDEN